MPDFRNMGSWLRVLLAVNVGALLVTLAANREWRYFPAEFIESAALVEPAALAALVLLTLIGGRLASMPKGWGVAVVLATALLVTGGTRILLAELHLLAADAAGPGRNLLWAAIATGLVLMWFELGARARAPAVAEARLLALTARIRPHFLFNSLNGVLGVIRTDPRRAENALEELADLFRVLMRENADLVPLSEEIQIARQYISLERLRLGERVRVTWDMAACPPDPLVPPLMLQPLLENAVYHGIEPATEPGEIVIRFECRDGRLRIELSNPMMGSESHTRGNQMALANIRERLMLFFDLDATLTTRVEGGRFLVAIEFPYRPVGAR